MIATLLLALVLLLLIASWSDMRRRIIPNWLNAAIAIAAPLFWWAQGLALWPDVAAQVGVALAVFALFGGLFALGLMGGGDAKLIGALALWVPPASVFDLLVLTALGGGIVTMATLAHHYWRRSGAIVEIPYGIAIAAAGIACLGQHYLYQFA